MEQVTLAVSRFFGFFFVLVITVAIVVAAYSLVAGQPVDKTWSAVSALILAAAVLLVLTALTAWGARSVRRLDA